MAFCEQCGNKLKDGVKFCGKCGTPVPVEQTEEPEADVQGASAPGACTQCGSPLEAGEMFCANCGTKIGAIPQARPAPVQTIVPGVTPVQPQAVSEEVLTEGKLFLHTGFLKGGGIPIVVGMSTFRGEWGDSILYKNRLEWKGTSIIVIPFERITSVKLIEFGVALRITLDNKNKFDFVSDNVQYWLNAINNARNGTF